MARAAQNEPLWLDLNVAVCLSPAAQVAMCIGPGDQGPRSMLGRGVNTRDNRPHPAPRTPHSVALCESHTGIV